MRYKIVRITPDGQRQTVNRAHTFSDVVEATDLCQDLNELAGSSHSDYTYAVESVQVVPARRL